MSLRPAWDIVRPYLKKERKEEERSKEGRKGKKKAKEGRKEKGSGSNTTFPIKFL